MKLKLITKSQIEKRLPEQKLNSEQKDEDLFVSQHSSKPMLQAFFRFSPFNRLEIVMTGLPALSIIVELLFLLQDLNLKSPFLLVDNF